jgi:hypothetical protein
LVTDSVIIEFQETSMLTRFVILVIAAWLAPGGAVAHAKVSPSLDTPGKYQQRLLERVIEDSADPRYCEVERPRGIDRPDRLLSRMPFPGDGNDACSMPAPRPDPFDDIARR